MSQRNEFRLDRIVSSQPDLGPSIPDGGYGWIILIASTILQIFIPSIISSYGIFMLYSRIEGSALSEEPQLWDTALLPTPIVFMAFWIIADPWSRTIVAASTWPRLVTTAGLFLTCAGLLLLWVAIKEMIGMPLYMLAGALSGIGSSLALTQSEVLISQYFRLKLLTIKTILLCAYALGFIIVPVMLGFLLFTRGILHSLLIYQAIILQCCIIISVFKKPAYLKAERRRYEAVQTVSEDDEMIFAKDVTELDSNLGSASTSRPINNIPILENTNSNNSSAINKVNNTSSRSNRLVESFNSETQNRNIQENNEPRPIFSDVNSTNITYTFDNNINSMDDNITILPTLPQRIITTTFKEEISFLWKLTFYKALAYLISIKYSMLVFWILFPTYLYVEMDKLQIKEATFIVGALGLGCLSTGIISKVFPVFNKNQHIVASTFFLLSSVGYFILSDSGSEGWFLFAALLITSSITALHALNSSITKFMLRDDNDKAHTLMHTLAGLSILLLLSQDATYRNCFRIMSLLQFLSGILFLYSFLFDYFKKLCSRT